MNIIAVDLGGTNTRIARFTDVNGTTIASKPVGYHTIEGHIPDIRATKMTKNKIVYKSIANINDFSYNVYIT